MIFCSKLRTLYITFSVSKAWTEMLSVTHQHLTFLINMEEEIFKRIRMIFEKFSRRSSFKLTHLSIWYKHWWFKEKTFGFLFMLKDLKLVHSNEKYLNFSKFLKNWRLRFFEARVQNQHVVMYEKFWSQSVIEVYFFRFIFKCCLWWYFTNIKWWILLVAICINFYQIFEGYVKDFIRIFHRKF